MQGRAISRHFRGAVKEIRVAESKAEVSAEQCRLIKHDAQIG